MNLRVNDAEECDDRQSSVKVDAQIHWCCCVWESGSLVENTHLVEIVVVRIEGIIKFRIYMSSSSGLLKGTCIKKYWPHCLSAEAHSGGFWRNLAPCMHWLSVEVTLGLKSGCSNAGIMWEDLVTTKMAASSFLGSVRGKHRECVSEMEWCVKVDNLMGLQIVLRFWDG